ncbi:MAG: hypothetical protein MI922_01720 [Bacteroidales bacterium]|nr:hypothetical protein [Bacteroidales bacterium]
MKIFIPVDNKDGSFRSKVNEFHNTNYACIYDTERRSYKWINTSDLGKDEVNLSFALKRSRIDIIISKDMPLMTLNFFKEMGLSVFEAKEDNVEKNIALLMNNSLNQVQSLKGTNACTTSCSSCSSNCS